jgi:hypothetical protein
VAAVHIRGLGRAAIELLAEEHEATNPQHRAVMFTRVRTHLRLKSTNESTPLAALLLH